MGGGEGGGGRGRVRVGGGGGGGVVLGRVLGGLLVSGGLGWGGGGGLVSSVAGGWSWFSWLEVVGTGTGRR